MMELTHIERRVALTALSLYEGALQARLAVEQGDLVLAALRVDLAGLRELRLKIQAEHQGDAA